MGYTPTLFVIYSTIDRIDYTSGDRVNELRLMKRLSEFFDVYYNDERFSPTKHAIGVAGRIGPVGNYDFYYIRHNREVFSRARGIRLAFAYPYDEHVFAKTDYLIVLSDHWKKHLLNRDHRSAKLRETLYGTSTLSIQGSIINVGQTYDERLRFARGSPQTQFFYESRLTRGCVFGFYGNLSSDLFPNRAFAALQRLWEENDRMNPVIGLAGRFRKGSSVNLPNAIYLGNIPYPDMPALYDTTLCVLTNETPLNNMLGNQKTLDAMSRGVVVLCQKLDTFVHQLGDEYPFFYENEEQAYRMGRQIVFDPSARREVGAALQQRADRLFSPAAATSLLRTELAKAGLPHAMRK